MICEDCYHYNNETDYCFVIKDKRPRILMSCDYFESVLGHLIKEEKISDKKDFKARYNFNCENKYRKVKMR